MKIVVPTNLGELSLDELTALERQLQDATTTVVLSGQTATDDDQANAVSLSAVSAELDRRETVEDLTAAVTDAATNAAVAAVLAHLEANPPAAADPAPVEDPAPAADPEDPAPVADPEDPAPVEDPVDPPAPGDLSANDPLTEPARPAGGRERVATLARSTSAHDRGYQLADSLELAEALHDVASNMSDGDSHRIASYDVSTDVVLGTDPVENSRMIQELINEGNADGAEALVASGGWITPSEIAYSFFAPETMDGLLDTPTVTVNRGGLRHITGGGPQINDVITTGASAMWVWDETTDITPGDTKKTRYKIPAPTWTDVRLAAYGVALDHGNLASRSFPELTRRWLALAPVAHEHEINRIRIAAIATASTAIDLSSGFEDDKGDAAITVLNAAAFQATKLREKYRMGFGTVVDAVFPMWVREAIRASFAKRSGFNGTSEASNDAIRSWFVDRGIRPQFVYDWQALPASEKIWGGASTVEKVDFLIYPAGTWVVGRGGSLDLGVHRDSTLNETNDYTALWTEQFLSLMRFGPESRKITVDVRVTGETYNFLDITTPAV